MYSPTLLDITPKPYSGPFRDFKGNLEINDKLNEVEILHQGDLRGPESMVFHDGYLYTGVEDGRIVKVKDGKITTVAQTGRSCVMPYEERVCGRPLGLRIGKDGFLYIIDAFYGIFTMNFTTGSLNRILSNNAVIDGQQMKFPDDLDIDDEGNIYFTDASTKWDLTTMYYLMFEYEAGGRVIRFNMHTRESEVLMKNLNFPNGVQLSKDKKFLLVCELMNRRILRYHLLGAQQGRVDVFSDALPGEPDNIRPSSRGYWVGFTSGRNSTHPLLPDVLAPYPTLKRLFARLYHAVGTLLTSVTQLVPCAPLKEFAYMFKKGDAALPLIRRHGIVIEFDEDGRILRSLHSPEGKISDLSEVKEYDGYLYLGSFRNDFLGRLKL
ncbi:hypothetical protein JTE90_006752 [Oedothorax gibbosus]|uniref:Strictosidine synthase conserved region domain-containing protein n=1 Tax=Oedothorax gibbosus TaxID=931172 RepID=A0AAV6UJQ3_9ARAC|nr:hypothetical protein JTE90_006752 [Oedothorax gibbosus]